MEEFSKTKTRVEITEGTRFNVKAIAHATKLTQIDTFDYLVTLYKRLTTLLRITEEKGDTCITVAEIYSIINTKKAE